jgi:hypothetical protein
MKIYLILLMLFLTSSVCLAEKTRGCAAGDSTMGGVVTTVCLSGCKFVSVTCESACCSPNHMAAAACGRYGGPASVEQCPFGPVAPAPQSLPRLGGSFQHR